MGIPVWLERYPVPGSGPEALSEDELPAVIEATGEEPVVESAAPEPRKDTSTWNWQELEAAVSGCQLCALHEGRTQTVFGTGDRQADWMLIGEAPGA